MALKKSNYGFGRLEKPPDIDGEQGSVTALDSMKTLRQP